MDIRLIARAEVVEHHDLVSAGNQGVDELGADESGPTGYQRSHRSIVPA